MSRASTRRPSASRHPSPSAASARRLLPWLVLGAVGVAAAGWWSTRTPAFTLAPDAERNVLLITIDTLRADALGSYGSGTATPTMDGLAARGARFDFAHAHAVVTLPSHASILTGRYPFEHGLRDNLGYRLAASADTMATHLSRAGFATGAFVGAFPLDRRFGLDAGFQTYDDRVGDTVSASRVVLPERRADAVVERAIEWIDSQSGKWFAWVHVFDPHGPYEAPEEWRARYPSAPYAAEVAWTDFALGQLIGRLNEAARPTLVVLTSDHGESLGDHGELTHGLFAYESTLRVPLIISVVNPAQRQARGVTIETPARHVDILPTVLEAVEAPAAALVSGRSLADTIGSGGGDDRPSYFEALTSSITRGWAPLRGVIVGREKLIELPIPELYDLSADPEERQNLLPNATDRAQVLAATLRTFGAAQASSPAPESATARERLRALGYLGGTASRAGSYTEADDPKNLVPLTVLLLRGAEAFDQGRIDDAVGFFEEVIARRPATEDAYRYLAHAMWQSGRPADAIATLERSLENGDSSITTRATLGTYLVEAGRAPRAIALLEGATDGDVGASSALGMAYASVGRFNDAIASFEKVLEIDPDDGLAHENIGAVRLASGDLTGAEASLTRALEIDDSIPSAHTTLGVVLKRTGRIGPAIAAWQRAIALDPGELDALYSLTFALAETGRMDEARMAGLRYLREASAAEHGVEIALIRALIDGR